MRILDGERDRRLVLDRVRRTPDLHRAIEQRAREILERVREEGEEAVVTITRQLDCRHIDALGLRVPEREIQAAYAKVRKDFLRALRIARKRITDFHRRQRPRSWSVRKGGVVLEQRFQPLRRVGIYVPGGKAAYPSTVLMNALPARIAGVEEIVMTTPCNGAGKIQPEVLVAAAECGITEIYRIGGAQAVAALAYGTESIRPVEKITGPGNAYVAAAKRMVFGTVGIDMIAGPTEVVIVADETAAPASVAADMIAQAEHDELAASVLLTTSRLLAGAVQQELERQLAVLPRQGIARRALASQGAIAVVKSLSQALLLVNEIAPEHLEVIVRQPIAFVRGVRNAGSIFVGPWSTEALGDYIAGPNHTLPTSGSARFSSPLGVSDFVKFMNVIQVSRRALADLGPHVEVLAAAEGLDGHAASIRVRR